jgi:hypothetical protein
MAKAHYCICVELAEFPRETALPRLSDAQKVTRAGRAVSLERFARAGWWIGAVTNPRRSSTRVNDPRLTF